jgi:uncharacterized DUF497 family protein
VTFEWDPAKARLNRRKHDVTFQEAASVFDDALSLTYSDPDHSSTESRFITMGRSSAGKILIIAHTDFNDSIRIISAREASRREKRHYEEET